MNMKYNLKHLLIAGFVALGLSSCDGFLNVMPSDALTTENAINNIDDVNAVLNGVYQSLLNEGYYGNDLIARAEMGGDDVQPTMEGKSRTDNWYRFMYRVNNSPEGLWYYPYKAISRANTLIDVIESGKIEASEELNIAKGEALAVRALCHFNLTITYGYPYQKDNGASYGIPLVLDVPTASDMPSRSSVAQCYAAIEQDLEDALDYLKNDTLVTEGHFNKWAVLGLQARVALYKGDYETAFSKASEVIEKGPYALIDHADYVTSWAEEFTTESVFDLYISALSQGNRELIGYLVDTNGYGEYAVTDEFLALLNENSDDVRLGLLTTDGNGELRVFNKYPGRNGATPVNNLRVIRLSDLYLIAAESALKKAEPNQEKADEYLNAIRMRAIPSATEITATEELVEIERRKELAMEGHRLHDVLRKGDEITRTGGHHFLNKEVDLITVNWDDYRCVMAIPQAEIDANVNIKDQQNPEYK